MMLPVVVGAAVVVFGAICWRAGAAGADVRRRAAMVELPVTPRAPFDVAEHMGGLAPARLPGAPSYPALEQRLRALRTIATMARVRVGRIDLPVAIVHALAEVNHPGERDAVLDAIGVLVGGRHQDVPEPDDGMGTERTW
jgi:hypothetical protein